MNCVKKDFFLEAISFKLKSMIAIAIFHGRKFSENVLKKNGSTLIMENQTRIQRFEIEFDEF